MAQLKDLIVNGASRLIGDAYTNKILITAISAPTASNGTTYGPGTNGLVLKSNGTSIYWANASTDTKNTAGATDTSSKLFLIGATELTANPQTYSLDTAFVGTNGHLYSASKEVLVGGSNASSTVTITPSTTSVYSMSSTGSVTAGTAPTFTRGSFNGGSLSMAMDATDSKLLNITFTAATHANDTFTQGTTPSVVVLPGRTQVTGLWNGYTAATAAAQTFTGKTS